MRTARQSCSVRLGTRAPGPFTGRQLQRLGRPCHACGRALGGFLQTIAQTMGPEAITTYINPEEVIKRLAAAQGIDVLNLVKSMQEVQQEQQQAAAQQAEQAAIEGTPALMKAPLMDPTKNPQLLEQQGAQQPPQE